MDNDGVCVASLLRLQNITDNIVDVSHLPIIIIIVIVAEIVTSIINWWQIRCLIVVLNPQFSSADKNNIQLTIKQVQDRPRLKGIKTRSPIFEKS